MEILSAALNPVSHAAQEPRLQVAITASCYLKADKHILTNCRRQTCEELKSPTPPVLPMHCLSQQSMEKILQEQPSCTKLGNNTSTGTRKLQKNSL